MADASKFDALSTAINSGLDNLRKWYRKADGTDVYFICLGAYYVVLCWYHSSRCFTSLALDPNYKVAYAKDKWTPRHFNDGMKRLQSVVSPSLH